MLKAHQLQNRADEQGRTPEELCINIPRFPVFHKPVEGESELSFPKEFLLEHPPVTNFTHSIYIYFC